MRCASFCSATGSRAGTSTPGHALTLYQRPQLTAVSADLANVGSFGFKSASYQDIGLVR